MMTTVEHLPGITGGIQVDINNKYSMHVFRGEEYLEHLDDLLVTVIKFDTGRFHNTKELANKMMGRNMRLELGQVYTSGAPRNAEEIPSITFFNKRVGSREYLAGLSQQRIFLIHTVSEGIVPLLYIACRILDEEDRGLVNLHLGRKAIQQARIIHGGAKWLSHRIGHEVPADSFAQATVWENGKLFPWKANFATVNSDGTNIQQELLTGLWYHTKINGTFVDMSTGISPEDYDEISTANQTRPGHPRLESLRAKMKENGFNFESRDSQYVIGKAA